MTRTMLPDGLTPAQIEHFITDGYVRVDDAFPREVAEAARAILWHDTGCSPDDPATWTRPVIRLGMYTQPPFVEAANTPRLHAAFDQMVGTGLWRPCAAMGTFPVRFPSPEDPGDAGWHIDVSFGTEAPDFLEWRANIHSKGRALLMLFLFSDVGEERCADPHPRRLTRGRREAAGAGRRRRDSRCVNSLPMASASAHREVALATGEAGTVYLCHPFLVHAAQPHRGMHPRFLAQPPLLPADPENRTPGDPLSVVKEATRRALAG